MVTIREVAKAAGVSVATASRALNGLTNVTASTREKIEAAATRLDYIPHSGARSLTRQRTDTIGVILPDLFGEFFSEIIRGIDKVVHAAGKHLLLGNMHGSPEETVQAIRAMRGRVDGLLVMPPNSRADTIAATGVNIPTVLLNARPDSSGTPFVTVDNYAGARLVTEHLIDRGARRIAHIAGPESNRDATERQRGYRDVVRERLGDRDGAIIPGNFREDAGRKAARELLAAGMPFDAVFSANDMMAVELIAELRGAGVRIGQDLLVAGFDDIPLARYVSPQLTTAHSDITRLGSVGAQMVLRMLDGEDLDGDGGLIISPTLAIRESTTGREQG